jgi:hypothetical protein
LVWVCEVVLDMVVCEEPGISWLCWQEVKMLSRTQAPMLREKGIAIVCKLQRESFDSRIIFGFLLRTLSTEPTDRKPCATK